MEQLELCQAMKKAMGFGPTRAQILLVWPYLVSNPGFRVWAQNWYLTSSVVLGYCLEAFEQGFGKAQARILTRWIIICQKLSFNLGSLNLGPSLDPIVLEPSLIQAGRDQWVRIPLAPNTPTFPFHVDEMAFSLKVMALEDLLHKAESSTKI